MRAPTQRVWVTGAHGFLGRAVCDALAAREISFACVARAAGSAQPLRPREEALVAWDLRNAHAATLEQREPPTAIFHLAAERPASFDAADVQRVADDNLRIDRNLFALAAAHGCHVLYASGCSVYGSRERHALREDAPCAPLGPYPAEKLVAEAEGAAHDAAGRFAFASLRISAPYAAGQKARTVLQHFASLALRSADLEFHGSGSREQDFIHARDVADAFLLGLEREARGVFNIAQGAPITMKALAERIIARSPGSSSHAKASGRPDLQEDLTARYDISRARATLGWSPRVSLDEGLREILTQTQVGA